MILVVDDDGAIRSSLTFLLKRAGYEPLAVPSPKEALEVIRRQAPRLVLMDMNYSRTTSGDEGLYLLKQVKVLVPHVPVILMTAWGSIALAVEGMRAGAFDFLTKPWNNLLLLNTIQTALALDEKATTNAADNASATDDAAPNDFPGIIGRSHVMAQILATVRRVAPTNASVLITGESGTGKELIAEAIHAGSTRAAQPFVKVNLGGISQSLFESEMFGHKKGAFTDAYADRMGRFSVANHGTLFLDEIGDLDLSCQVKLLRVLQDQTFEVLGESRPTKVDVRIVSATNCDLRAAVTQKTFREDLFYRINLISIHLPPLRERIEDIPLLAHHFATGITPQAIAYLQTLPFTGNVRELKNLVERTRIVSGKDALDAADFQAQYQALHPTPQAAEGGGTLEEVERQKVVAVLSKHKGNVSRAAAELGVSRAALYRRMEKFNLPTHES